MGLNALILVFWMLSFKQQNWQAIICFWLDVLDPILYSVSCYDIIICVKRFVFLSVSEN